MVVIIRNLFIRHSTFPRHAQPSLLPVKEAGSVLSRHKAFRPSNNTITGNLQGGDFAALTMAGNVLKGLSVDKITNHPILPVY